MAHRLQKGSDVAAELVRFVRDDIAAALAAADDGGPLNMRVHAIRQRLKWARSTLRVLHGTLGEEARAARLAAAAAAQLLSGARDADVAAASARVLSATAASAAEAGFDRVADRLDHEAAAAHRQHLPLAEVKQRLESIAHAVGGFATDFEGEALIEGAIKRAYRNGRRAMKRAEMSRGTDDLHGWRKRARHLWHLLRMGRDLIPRRTSPFTASLDRLIEILGLDHDHALLAERLALAPHDAALQRQLALIADRRRGMEADAFSLGADLYDRKPKAFARRYRLRASPPDAGAATASES
jgi:hypothetical protein